MVHCKMKLDKKEVKKRKSHNESDIIKVQIKPHQRRFVMTQTNYSTKHIKNKHLTIKEHGNQFCRRILNITLKSSKQSNISLESGRLDAVFFLNCLSRLRANLRR